MKKIHDLLDYYSMKTVCFDFAQKTCFMMFPCHVYMHKNTLYQWFSNLSLGPPTTAYFVCLPRLTRLIQLISSLVKSARFEIGVAYERDIQLCDGWSPQDRFENHCSISMILKSGPLLQSLALTLIKHLSMLIRVFKIIRKSQVGEFDQGWS